MSKQMKQSSLSKKCLSYKEATMMDEWTPRSLPPLALPGIFGDLGVVSSWQAKTSWPDGYYGSLNATKAGLLMFAWRKQHDVIGLINKAIMHQGICYLDSILKFMVQNFLNTKWKMVHHP